MLRLCLPMYSPSATIQKVTAIGDWIDKANEALLLKQHGMANYFSWRLV